MHSFTWIWVFIYLYSLYSLWTFGFKYENTLNTTSQRALTKIVAEIWPGTGAYGKMTLMYVWSKPNKSEILRSGPFWEISHSIFQVEISLNSTKIGPKSILSPFFDFYIIWFDKYNGMWFGNMLSVPRNALTLKKMENGWNLEILWIFDLVDQAQRLSHSS